MDYLCGTDTYSAECIELKHTIKDAIVSIGYKAFETILEEVICELRKVCDELPRKEDVNMTKEITIDGGKECNVVTADVKKVIKKINKKMVVVTDN
jgi:hypothetical protein